MRRVIVPVLADTHGGHRLSLLNPETTLFDVSPEGDYAPRNVELSESQLAEWEHYTNSLDSITKLAGKDEVIAVHNGDLTWGKKYPDQLVSTRDSDQIHIAEMNLIPLMDMESLTKLRIIAGTDSHAFYESSSEIEVARNLQYAFPNKDVRFVFHGRITINDLIMDVAHHGPSTGIRHWLRGDELRRYVRSYCYYEMAQGNPMPDVIIRSHFHDFVEEVVPVNGHKIHAFVTPSYSMLNNYARQAVRSPQFVSIGMFALEIVDGKLVDVHKYIQKYDVRSKESL